MASLQNSSVTGNTVLDKATCNVTAGGFLWYNTSTCRLNYSYSGAGAASWSTTSQMITTRRLLGGAGTVNATLALPGYKDGSGVVNCVEKFDGSSWSSAGSMIIN